jgi:hypothetical protein
MPVTGLDILSRDAYEGGRTWGDVGAYERIDAVVHYAVSPGHPSNRGVVDLELAERGEDGLVHFSGDLTILRPIEAAAGNRALLLQVPNRGRRLLGRFHMSEGEKGDDGAILPGDGFLFRHGWTIVWAGWQWDVPVTPERHRIGLAAPQVPAAARTPHSRMQLRYQLDRDHACLPLTDHHVGDLGRHKAIPAADREGALPAFATAPLSPMTAMSGSQADFRQAASTISFIRRWNARWWGRGCWRCAMSRPICAATGMRRPRDQSTMSSPKGSRNAAVCCAPCSTTGSTWTKTARLRSTACWRTSPAAAAVSSIIASASRRFSRRRPSVISFRLPTRSSTTR